MEDFDKQDLLKSDRESKLEKELSKLKELMEGISKKRKAHRAKKLEDKLRKLDECRRKYEEEGELNPEDLFLL